MKSEAKMKRLAILKRIDAWEKERCEVCGGAYANTNESTHCKCAAAVAIRELGVQYEDISKASREGRIEALIDEIKADGLSVEVYRKLRENHLNDLQIFRAAGIPKTTFNLWKFDAGLTGRPSFGKEEIGTPEYTKPREYEKYGVTKEDVEFASANGITYKAFVGRLKIGWPRHKAMTTPVNTKRKPKKAPSIERKYVERAAGNGINYSTLYRRVFEYKWDLKRATTEPVRVLENNYQKWTPIAEKNGISYRTLKGRVERGEAIEEAAVRPLRGKEKVTV